jgi:Arc/MetJ-type ribon-helix-helix transcriptional regulator
MDRVRKTITLPKDLAEWAENVIKDGKYPGIRSLSGFIEFLIRNEREKKRVK